MKDGKKVSKWAVWASCSLTSFLIWLDVSIINTAIPQIQKELSASILQMQWMMDAFIFAITVLIVTLGRVGDHYGRKKLNMMGVFLFAISSLFAGMSHSPQWLIICRFIQGIASAAIIPSALALLSHAFAKEERGKALGLWSALSGIALATGPLVGGFFVSMLDWRWIFYINIPFAIASLILIFLFVHESKQREEKGLIEWKAVGLFTLGLGLLLFAVMHGPDWGWMNEKTILSFFFSLLFLLWFYFFEKKSIDPIIPFGLLQNGSFLFPALVMFNVIFVFNAILFLVPLYLIQVRGQQAYEAGLTLLPFTLSIAIFSPISGHFVQKLGGKRLILMGLFFFFLGTFLQSFFAIKSSFYLILTALFFLGVGWGFARPPATGAALNSASHRYAGTVTGLLWSLQNGGGALGIAIILTLFRKIYQAQGDSYSFMAGYQLSMMILSAIIFLTMLVVAFFYRESMKKE